MPNALDMVSPPNRAVIHVRGRGGRGASSARGRVRITLTRRKSEEPTPAGGRAAVVPPPARGGGGAGPEIALGRGGTAPSAAAHGRGGAVPPALSKEELRARKDVLLDRALPIHNVSYNTREFLAEPSVEKFMRKAAKLRIASEAAFTIVLARICPHLLRGLQLTEEEEGALVLAPTDEVSLAFCLYQLVTGQSEEHQALLTKVCQRNRLPEQDFRDAAEFAHSLSTATRFKRHLKDGFRYYTFDPSPRELHRESDRYMLSAVRYVFCKCFEENLFTCYDFGELGKNFYARNHHHTVTVYNEDANKLLLREARHGQQAVAFRLAPGDNNNNTALVADFVCQVPLSLWERFRWEQVRLEKVEVQVGRLVVDSLMAKPREFLEQRFGGCANSAIFHGYRSESGSLPVVCPRPSLTALHTLIDEFSYRAVAEHAVPNLQLHFGDYSALVTYGCCLELLSLAIVPISSPNQTPDADSFFQRFLATKTTEQRQPEEATPTDNCAVCMSAADQLHVRLSVCGHLYCGVCLLNHLGASKHFGQRLLRCVLAECSREILFEDVFSIASRHFRSVDEVRAQFAPLLHRGLRAYLDAHSELVQCRAGGCCSLLPSAKSAPKSSTTPCPRCAKVRCAACGEDPHPGKTCDQHKELLYFAKNTSLAEWAKSLGPERFMLCPNKQCNAPIEKQAGCNHVNCEACDKHFCWKCQFMPESNNLREVYEHMMEAHGGFAEEPVVPEAREEEEENNRWWLLDYLEELEPVDPNDERVYAALPHQHAPVDVLEEAWNTEHDSDCFVHPNPLVLQFPDASESETLALIEVQFEFERFMQDYARHFPPPPQNGGGANNGN